MNEIKTLFIIRHGKSSWGYENIADIDRPLKNRGIRNAYEMADRINQLYENPDLIISSPANRALHTAIIFSRVLNIPTERIKIENNIYDGYESAILDTVKKTTDAVSSIMIFGHNPGFTNLANTFVKNYIEYIPTAGVVILKFATESWIKINKKNVAEEFYDFPKNIG